MRTPLSRLLAPVALGTALVLGACHPARPRTLEVQDAWARLAPMPGRPAAAYLTIRGGGKADRLVAITSPKVERIEMHSGGMEHGMATMHPIAGLDVPAGSEARFAPGGDHAMLFGVDPAIRPGDRLPLTLRFASGATLGTEARTIAAGDPAPATAEK